MFEFDPLAFVAGARSGARMYVLQHNLYIQGVLVPPKRFFLNQPWAKDIANGPRSVSESPEGESASRRCALPLDGFLTQA